MGITIKIPSLLKYLARLKKAEIIFKYYSIANMYSHSTIKVGTTLYRINPTSGKLLAYKVEKIDGSWFSLSNETGNICASVQCLTNYRNSLNKEYWISPFLATWDKIRKIREEQYKLEQKRIQIIETNNIKIKIYDPPSKKKRWWNRFFQ